MSVQWPLQLLILEGENARWVAATIAGAQYRPAPHARLRLYASLESVATTAALVGAVGTIDEAGHRWTVNGRLRAELVLRWCLQRHPDAFRNWDSSTLPRVSGAGLCAMPGCPALCAVGSFCWWHREWADRARLRHRASPGPPASRTAGGCLACHRPTPIAGTDDRGLESGNLVCEVCASWIGSEERSFFRLVNGHGLGCYRDGRATPDRFVDALWRQRFPATQPGRRRLSIDPGTGRGVPADNA